MFLLIDKPKGVTSHDVVDRIRKITGERRVGHGGTLDPNATGLLIIAVGRESTRKIWDLLKDSQKEYEAEIFLGEERDTDDVMGTMTNAKSQMLNSKSISKKVIMQSLKFFLGEQEQTPPQYSAVKIKGKKAYESARRGLYVQMKSRKVTFYTIKVMSYKYPVLKVIMEVSGGTYIRSFARDLGRKLGTGAYLSNLRRTKIGKFRIDNSVKLDNLSVENLASKYVT